MKAMHILLVNVHSAHNLGDEAIMRVTLEGLRQAFPAARITVAANDPASWQAASGIGCVNEAGVEVVGSLTSWVVARQGGGWRWQKPLILRYALLLPLLALVYRLLGIPWVAGTQEQRRLLWAYYRADLVVSCGGGNFYAHRSLSIGLLWGLGILGFAALLGKRIILLPQSVGPIAGRGQRWLVRTVLQRAGLILLREQHSLALLQQLGVHTHMTVLPDLAFALPANSARDAGAADMAAVRIGVTVIDRAAQEPGFAGQQRYEDALVALLLRLGQQHGAQITLLVQCSGPSPHQDDRQATRRVYERLRQQGSRVSLHEDFADALALQAACSRQDCVLSSRMHTGILALNSLVPVLMIAYQPKAHGMMQMYGLERYCWSIEQVEAEAIYQAVCAILEHHAQVRLHISQRRDCIRLRLQAWQSYVRDASELT